MVVADVCESVFLISVSVEILVKIPFIFALCSLLPFFPVSLPLLNVLLDLSRKTSHLFFF